MAPSAPGRPVPASCCPASPICRDITRRRFFGAGGAALGGLALGGLAWPFRPAAEAEAMRAPPRAPLVVKPVFTYTKEAGYALRKTKIRWESLG